MASFPFGLINIFPTPRNIYISYYFDQFFSGIFLKPNAALNATTLSSVIASNTSLSAGRPIPHAYYYKHYYKNACSVCMPVIPIVIPV